MFDYRLSAPVLPIFLLLLLPALAAYPWQLPIGTSLALPFLTLLVILFCALRYPGILVSPVVFVSGMLCDLFTRSPLGYWVLLFLLALACARATTLIVESHGRFAGWLCFFITLAFTPFAALAVASLYQFEWQAPTATIEGMLMALALLPLPVLLLVGLEKLLILPTDNSARPYR